MSGGERPIGTAKGKQSDTEALCQHPPPPPDQSDHRGGKRNLQSERPRRAIFGTQTFGSQTPPSPTSLPSTTSPALAQTPGGWGPVTARCPGVSAAPPPAQTPVHAPRHPTPARRARPPP